MLINSSRDITKARDSVNFNFSRNFRPVISSSCNDYAMQRQNSNARFLSDWILKNNFKINLNINCEIYKLLRKFLLMFLKLIFKEVISIIN